MALQDTHGSTTPLDRDGTGTRDELAKRFLASSLPSCSWSSRKRNQQCRRWTCPACRLVLTREAYDDIRRGLRSAHDEGLWTRHLTITQRPSDDLHLREFNRRFSRLSEKFGRAGLRWQHYLSTLAVCPQSGRLHRHLAAIGGPFIEPESVAEHAERAGFGFIDIKAINPSWGDRHRIARYLASDGLLFAVAHLGSMARIQPFSRSR